MLFYKNNYLLIFNTPTNLLAVVFLVFFRERAAEEMEFLWNAPKTGDSPVTAAVLVLHLVLDGSHDAPLQPTRAPWTLTPSTALYRTKRRTPSLASTSINAGEQHYFPLSPTLNFQILYFSNAVL